MYETHLPSAVGFHFQWTKNLGAGHQWAPDLAVFHLGLNHFPMAIRDQMVRSHLIAVPMASWLKSRTNTSSIENMRILIIGGGFGGLSMAHALASQISNPWKIWIAEKANRLIPLQAGKTPLAHEIPRKRPRHLHPHAYDWPMSHYTKSTFPEESLQKQHSLFTYQANWSNTIDFLHVNKFHEYLQTENPPVEIRLNTFADLENIETRGPLESVSVKLITHDQSGVKSDKHTFAAIILAVGFGEEPNTLALDKKPGTYVSYRFWEQDPFLLPHSGLPSHQQEKTVLISGSGDGGLQDLIRVITRLRSAIDVLAALGLHADHFGLAQPIDRENHRTNPPGFDLFHQDPAQKDRFFAFWHQSLLEILSHETEFLTLSHWQINEHLHSLLRKTHLAHLAIVQKLLAWEPLRNQIAKVCELRPQKTILLGRGNFFKRCYALNRFLALLFIEALKDSDRPVQLLEGELVDIESREDLSQSTSLTADQCLGGNWQPVIKTKNAEEIRLNAGVIVLRHGPKPRNVSVRLVQDHDQKRTLWPTPPFRLH